MKLKYRKQFFRAISLLLIIALLCPISLNTVAIRANAVENVTEEKSAVKEDVIAETVSLGDTLEVPGFVSQAQIEEHGHVSRLVDEETLNTLVYLNRDGTKTKYIMDYPVKYIDENGDTKFVDLSLGETTTAFETTANDIVLSVSKDYTKGITLAYKDYTVSLVAVPNSNRAESGSISTAPITVAAKNNNAITYNDVFATDIDIRYSPLHNGVKEDIILQTYNGTNTFHFLLSTSGLGVYSEKDNYYLAEAANADMRMDLGKVIVYDANRKISEGSLTVTTLKENQLYQVTVSVDQAFLADPNTVYPVQIDPSITVSDTTHGANAVTDCPVYSGKPAVNMGTALYNPIGYLDSAYQIGRTAVKLVGLANDPVYQGLSAAQIQSAYFYIKDSSGTAAKSINLYALTSNSTWTESSLTWNTLGTISSTLQASANVGGAAWSSFNITNLVKGWKSSSYNINCGFILQSSNESAAGNFFSSEAAETNWPYLVLNYTDIVSSITLSSTSVSIVEGGTKTLVATTNPIGQTVTWYTSNSAVATVSSSGVVTAKKAGTATITASMVDPNGITKTATCVVYVYIANGVYYIKNLNSNYYLHVKYGGIANYTDVYQYSKYSDSASNNYRIQQMWKIYYLGDGRYSIRPLNKLDKGLDVTGGNVDIYNIGTSDTLSSVPSYGEWTISWYSTGYVFKNNGSDSQTMQIENASTSSGATVVASAYSTSVNCRWGLTKVSSPPSGIYLYDTSTNSIITTATRYVAPKESRTLSEQSISVISYDGSNISQSFSWTPTNGSFVSVNSSGTITGKSAGTTTITAQKVLSGTTYSVSYTVITTPIANGTYYMQNKQTGYYADIEGPTMASGTTIHQWEYHGGSSQEWIFKHLGDGYYSIKSSNSSSTYYMGVVDDSTALDVDVVLRTGTITNGVKWKIESTVNGAYKIIPKTGVSSGYVLATTTSNASNGYKLIQGDYIDNNSYRDEWLINSVTYSINLEPQHQSNWCWAASARMSSQSKTVGAITQESAAVYVKLDVETVSPTATQITNANVGATVGETEQALEYILGSNNVYSNWGVIYSESVLRTLLDNNNPVIILRGWYDSSGARTGGHYVVIYDYHWDSTNGLYVYDINDPWVPNVGECYSRSYLSICNGRAPAYASDRTDTGIWEGIVVYQNGNYTSTISWPGV